MKADAAEGFQTGSICYQVTESDSSEFYKTGSEIKGYMGQGIYLQTKVPGFGNIVDDFERGAHKMLAKFLVSPCAKINSNPNGLHTGGESELRQQVVSQGYDGIYDDETSMLVVYNRKVIHFVGLMDVGD